jgi:2-amino-4-hydroxy-6-hydroxymethyldihydropteridine diphosphokinase
LETDAARVRVAVALGSNLGDREAHLTTAASRLASLVAGLQLSPFFDTAPVDVAPQPRFLNAAAVGWTMLSARELLDGLLAIEAVHGRERPHTGAPRTLDLDLILYGDAVIDEPGLEVPHPRFRGRRFVLEPLAAIAPDLEDPVTGKRVSELLAELPP